ncbi:MAG TPA: hypothetical protein VFV56_01420 [Gaiellaceae bacterium]|nr:hypothetical protein [Gaiellaceae bacterium]
MIDTLAERYVVLGLQLGRHVDGIAESYFGPAELAEAADAGPLVEPRELVDRADGLLAELPDGWLRDQVRGLRTYAGVLAGERLSYADEVEQCYCVRPRHTDESVFSAAHDELDRVLPGAGPVAERHRIWEESMRVPGDAVERTVAAVIQEARRQTRALVELPGDEDVTVEIVHDEPWLAFCEYLGDLQSTISVNGDLPISAIELLSLAIHETYPGHHTERCCKEQALVRGRGLLEETLVLVPTPQSMVAEGIATIAPWLLLEGDGASALAGVVRREAGVELDLDLALAVGRALEPCRWANLNAALMLHEAGARESEVQAYLERWGLLTPDLAAHLIRFLQEPTSRTYIITYLAGRELTRAYVGTDGARFRRLLTEQVRVGELLADGDITPP